MRRRALLLAAALAGFSPFRVEEPNVREGNQRLATGDPAGALRAYEGAEKAAGPHGEIDYDRGGALFRQGQAAEAREAWQRSIERGPGSLGSRASQNIGTALAAAGDREGAIAAFTEALRKDPENEDARFDLEVLLRKKQEEEKRQQAQRQDQGGGSQEPQPGKASGEGQKQSSAGETRDRSQPDRGAERPPPASPQPQAGGPERPPEQAGAPEGGDQRRPAGSRPGEGEISRADAERILDAFRAREQPMPPPERERRSLWRRDADRDW